MSAPREAGGRADPHRPENERQFAAFVERVANDASVLGVVLFGSRGYGAFVTPASDFDAFVVVTGDPAPWRTPHGSPVEVWPMGLEEFRSHGLPGSSTAWNRPTFLGTRVLLDRLDGEIDRIVDRKRRLDPDEAREVAAASLGDYTNRLHRALRGLEAGRDLEGRLDALESLSPLLTTVFALEGRVRPFNKWLRHELAAGPLGIPGLLAMLDSISASPTPDNQRELFRLVERTAQAAGHGAVIDDWGPDVRWLRGE